MISGKNDYIFTLNNIDTMSEMAKALSSPIRLEILEMLIERSMNMSQLSQKLYVSLSSVSMHIKILQDVGLVESIPKPGMHGAQKLCGITADKVLFDLFSHKQNHNITSLPKKVMEIPIGCYSSIDIQSPCGIVSSEDYIDLEDEQF